MILDFAQLQKASGCEQRAAVIRWLKSRGIAFMLDAKHRPVTTVDAFDRALYGRASRPDWTPPKSSRRKSIGNMAGTTTSTGTPGTR